MKSISAVVAGHICIDILPEMSDIDGQEFAQTFHPGQLVEIGPARFSTGGPVSNTGLALHRLGIDTRLIAKVGDDLFGRALLDLISRISPDLIQGMVVTQAAATSYSVIISPGNADRAFLHHPGANHTFGAEDLDDALIAQARLFHFGYPPIMRRMYANDGAELATLLRRVKARDVTTSLDTCVVDPTSPAGRADWRKILSNALPYVDIFLPSVEEIFWMLRREQFHQLNAEGGFLSRLTPALLEDLSHELMDLGARVVAIKLGERGLYLHCAERPALAGMGPAAPAHLDDWAGCRLWAPCFQVEVRGATGAGDSTIAGFLAGLLRGLGPVETITLATAVGACNVEAPDALSGLRSWEDTLRRVSAGWPRRVDSIADSAWLWDETAQIWRKPKQ